MENDCLESGGIERGDFYHLAEKKRFTALYERVLGRSWSHFVDSWNNAKMCLNYGEPFPSLSEGKKAVDIWTTLRSASSCPHTHSTTATNFLIFKNKKRKRID